MKQANVTLVFGVAYAAKRKRRAADPDADKAWAWYERA